MPQNWKVLTISFVTIFSIVALFGIKAQPESVRGSQTKQIPTRGQTIEEADVSQFPIVDHVAEMGLTGKARAKWEAKGKKYNSRHAPPINEFSNQVVSFIDWERGLPAFPFDRSSSVIIGQITEAQAHLSSDETKIYSEFTVQVDEVLKNDDLVAANSPEHSHS